MTRTNGLPYAISNKFKADDKSIYYRVIIAFPSKKVCKSQDNDPESNFNFMKCYLDNKNKDKVEVDPGTSLKDAFYEKTFATKYKEESTK